MNYSSFVITEQCLVVFLQQVDSFFFLLLGLFAAEPLQPPTSLPNPPAFRSPNTLPTLKLNSRNRLSPSCPLFCTSYQSEALRYQIPKLAHLPSPRRRGQRARQSRSRERTFCASSSFPPAEQKQAADGLVGPHSPTNLIGLCVIL